MRVGFLVTSPYQVFHYRQIARHLDSVGVICEARRSDLGLETEAVAAAFPGADIDWVTEDRLADLDGRFDAIVCQTPILPLKFLRGSRVIAQQYSLAKQRYQYGIWRAQADLNLMYGPTAVSRVAGFARAVAVGNPLLDPYWQLGYDKRRVRFGTGRPRLLYAPTYGSLSSLPTIAERLSNVDADITVKLHHADDAAALPALRDDVRIVTATADPAELFHEHDGVLSDVSGAVYDALYAGLPVVLVDPGVASDTDYARLAPEEHGAAHLAGVTETWQPGTDLIDAFRSAQAKQETTGYNAFIADNFVNPGTAGQAAAEEIRRLLTDGSMPHFGADQVAETARRYITINRELRSGGPAKESTADAARIAEPETVVQRAYRQARTRLARVGTLKHAVHRVRRLKRHYRGAPTNLPVGNLSEPRPAYRREAVWEQLRPGLAAAGVQAARDTDRPGATVGIRKEHADRLFRALRGLAGRNPALYVRIGAGQKTGKLSPLRNLAEWELFGADWIDIGELTERAPFERDPSGYLTIEFVAYQAERNRYLAVRTAAKHPDWTRLLDPARVGGEPVTVGESPDSALGPIDVVYTWVDSRDPAWQAARQQYGTAESGPVSADNDERYIDRDELKHSLRSLWMFAPFVRNIYIVTAGQRPAWLSTMDPRVRVVSHHDVFGAADVLPTFNSHAIESCLHRIPGLSENFLYFNDDVFLGRETTAADFFTSAGLAKVRLSPSQYIYEGEPEPDAIPTDWAAYNSTALIARDFGQPFTLRVKHVPLPLKKSVLTEIETRYAAEMERTRAARFRSRTDLAVPSMFAQYYAIATGRAVEWPDPKHSYVYLDTGKHSGMDRFKWVTDWRPMFYCLNCTRFTEVPLSEQAARLNRFYRRVLPHPAPWEVDPLGRDTVRRTETPMAQPHAMS